MINSSMSRPRRGFKAEAKQLPHQLPCPRAAPHALLLHNAIDDGSARCPALAPTRAAPTALDRRPKAFKKLCVSPAYTARRTRVSTIGKQPDPFVLTAGNYCKTSPVRGGAPRVVAVGSARRRESLSRPVAPS